MREQIAATLDALVAALREALDDRLIGAYLVGSFALGAGDEHSDVDFLAVTDDEPDEASEQALRELHARLPDLGTPGADHLEGSYAPTSDLRSPMTLGRRWLYVDNGSRLLERSAHDNTAHTRWVLREHGMPLVGPDPRTLVAEVTPKVLRAEALGVARARAEAGEEDLEAYADPWYQPYAVLTSCRILFTASEGRVTTKPGAAAWALDRVDATHRELIRAAVERRTDPALAAPTRAFVWDVVRLAGSAALAARAE